MPIELYDYGFTYALSPEPSLTGINLAIYPGEILVLCGTSGSGKSTLLRSLKQAVTPAGTRSGHVTGLPADMDIAIVFQNPETQAVTPLVINDLVFQMENRGMNPVTMKKRMSETVGFFGLEEWLYKPTQQLSGGQKQLAALCAALMCEPQLLLLDEPISQLDPLAAEAFLEHVKRVNRELGITVVMSEHRLDECVGLADRIAFMEAGTVAHVGAVEDALRFIFRRGYTGFVPQIPKASLYIDNAVVLTPRAFKERYPSVICDTPAHSREKNISSVSEPNRLKATKVTERLSAEKNRLAFDRSDKTINKKEAGYSDRLLRLTDVTVYYANRERPVINRLTLEAVRGECLCLLGGNGSGKSTLLKLIAGIIKPKLGRVRTDSKRIGYMPQHIRDYFLHDRVANELENPHTAYTQALAARLGITNLLDKHPFDISGGEQQRAVLLAILSRQPELIILDEPTKGMDPEAKELLSELLHETGAAVIIATHDVEFAVNHAERCAMLFNGEIAYTDSPRRFFAGNQYYTTAIHKAMRHINESAVVLQDVFDAWALPAEVSAE